MDVVFICFMNVSLLGLSGRASTAVKCQELNSCKGPGRTPNNCTNKNEKNLRKKSMLRKICMLMQFDTFVL